MPEKIIQKAKEIEKSLDKTCDEKKVVVQSLFSIDSDSQNEKIEKYNKLKEKLENLDIYNITPIQALQILEKLKSEL